MSLSRQNGWGFGKKDAASAPPETEVLANPAPSVTKPATSPSENANARFSPATSSEAASARAKKESAAPEDAYLEMKSNIHRRLIEEIDLKRLGDKDETALRKQIREAILHLVLEESHLLTSSERDRLVEDILNEAMGLGPLEQLLRDPGISEIMILGPQLVYVERHGKLTESRVRFKDDAHLLQIIDRIVSAVGRRVDETQPLCDARLKDGSRFNCVIPPLALDGPLVTIRKFSKDPLTVDDLIRFGSLTQDAAELLRGLVEARLNVVISGGTGSGKTTLLNVLSGFIPEDERIVTIEDTAELQLQQKHVARLETRPSNLEGKGEITMRDLVKNSLRMRPERIVVGECRSGETLDMLQAMNTGHDGSLTTLHANTPRDAIRRMETMVMMAGYDLPQKAIREQIASAVHVIIQASRLSDGSRRVLNITEVVGMEGDVVLLQDIFHFVQRGLDENNKLIGEFKATGIRPRFLDVLKAEGIVIDERIFEDTAF
jgi:pilus assembly protein CpaF